MTRPALENRLLLAFTGLLLSVGGSAHIKAGEHLEARQPATEKVQQTTEGNREGNTEGNPERRLSFDPEASKITFTLGAVLHTVHGTAKLAAGEVVWNLGADACSGALIIDATSLDTGSKKRDRVMHGKVLESESFPTIEFECETFTGAVDDDGLPLGDFTVHGTFSIHGTHHQMTIPMALETTNGVITLSGTLEVPYVEWGMKDPSKPFLRAAKVVSIQLELTVAGTS